MMGRQEQQESLQQAVVVLRGREVPVFNPQSNPPLFFTNPVHAPRTRFPDPNPIEDFRFPDPTPDPTPPARMPIKSSSVIAVFKSGPVEWLRSIFRLLKKQMITRSKRTDEKSKAKCHKKRSSAKQAYAHFHPPRPSIEADLEDTDELDTKARLGPLFLYRLSAALE